VCVCVCVRLIAGFVVVLDSPVHLNCVVQTRSGVQSTHLGVVSHDGNFQQNRVCKKGGVFDLRHCRESLFVALWNVCSLVECVGDARRCGVSKTSMIFRLIVS